MNSSEKNDLLSVIVPLYNEADNILPLYEKVTGITPSLGCDLEIILVNDGSTDDSREILDDLSSLDDRVKVIHFRRNFGQTTAIMAGIDYSSGNVLIPMDGDLQNDPQDIPKLLSKLKEGFEVCSGWREDRKD
ncbi:MAG: glycosyltransferase family 2 protein, partial [Desulfobacterales bacterium]